MTSIQPTLTRLTSETGRRTRVVALVLVVGLLALLGHSLVTRSASAAEPSVPTSAAMEDALGLRFSRVAVVGDGGLLEVSYVVLDPEKVTRFQADRTDLPVLRNEATGATTKRVALMKQGHSVAVGQTFYYVYNNAGTVHPGDHASIAARGITLAGIPVR